MTTMTTEEIVRDYRQAADKHKQIGILADLNQCTKAEIVAILRGAGIKVSGHYNAVHPPQTAAAKPAEDQAEADAEVIRVADALPVMIRSAAVQVIAQLIKKADSAYASACPENLWGIDINFREQCRGVLALVDEVEKRCTSVEEESDE